MGAHACAFFRSFFLLLLTIHQVLRHPHFKGAPTHPYSHHQKFVVVDYGTKHIKVPLAHHLIVFGGGSKILVQGFVGGFDVAFGRWDTQDHVIVDENRLNQLSHELHTKMR